MLRKSALDFQESSGLIAGGLLTLAVFVFVTAMINREWTYVIFAVWLVGNLRLCANAMGWDMEWVGRVIPPEYLQIIRQLTFAVYYLLTAALFSSLFRRELKVIGYKWLLRIVHYVGLVLLGAAIVLPYARFIPTLWVITGFGVFEKIARPARKVRNPRTGERKRAKATAVPRFRAGTDLKAFVSGEKKVPRAAKAAAKSAATKSTAAKAPAKAAATKATATKAASTRTAAPPPSVPNGTSSPAPGPTPRSPSG